MDRDTQLGAWYSGHCNLGRVVVWMCLVFAALTVLIVTCAGWHVYRAVNPNPASHVFAIEDAAPLDEATAIEYTRRALVAEGKDTPGMNPEPYWPDSQYEDGTPAERLFARNRIDPNSGYVIWSVGYHVTIERTGTRVICRVYSPK